MYHWEYSEVDDSTNLVAVGAEEVIGVLCTRILGTVYEMQSPSISFSLPYSSLIRKRYTFIAVSTESFPVTKLTLAGIPTCNQLYHK